MAQYALIFVFISALLALVYGLATGFSILRLDPGNERMQKIASAIQEGASAYMNRQYLTISIVGITLF